MKILIIAYACEPLKGSEPGVGWNMSQALAKLHDVTVLTRCNNRNVIEQFVGREENAHLHFIYHDLPTKWMWIKKRCGIQAYYVLWNLTARRMVKKYIVEHPVDLVHHLTFNQYRTPSIGYFLPLPFVIGPIGGAERINSVFYKELEPDTLKREKYRSRGSDFRLFAWLGRRTKTMKAYIFSAKENAARLQPYTDTTHSIVRVLPAIAIDKNDFRFENGNSKDDTFIMIYAGRAVDWKGLHVFLLALSNCASQMKDYRVRLIGIRSEEERKKVTCWISEMGLSGHVELIDFMARPELLQQLQKAHLLVYPAFRDSGSMAVLEACTVGCPAIAFDAGGQDAFPDDILLKVSIGKTFDETVDNLSEKLIWAYRHPTEIQTIGNSAHRYAMTKMTWEVRVQQIADVYNEITSK